MTENLVNFDIATHDSDKIKELITKIKSDFIYLGLLLKEFKEAEEYKNLNYSSFESYVENELHFNKSTAYNLIAVQERFGDGMNINKKYVDYSYSQLRELVKFSDKELNEFPANLSVRSILQKKKDKQDSTRVETVIKNKIYNIKLSNLGDDVDSWDSINKHGAYPARNYIDNIISSIFDDLSLARDDGDVPVEFIISITKTVFL